MPRPSPHPAPWPRAARRLTPILLASLLIASFASAQAPAPRPAAEAQAPRASAREAPRPQPRAFASRVAVPLERLEVDDGDTIEIVWAPADTERVRILGIDTPETAHPQHDLPYAQSFGAEAKAFARGAFAAATQVELLRSATLDPYGRTLGYLFLNGRNYSVLVVQARLAEESVTRYGDNGLPAEAAEVLAAAKAAGPLPFESPGDYRRRMREVSRWMKTRNAAP